MDSPDSYRLNRVKWRTYSDGRPMCPCGLFPVSFSNAPPSQFILSAATGNTLEPTDFGFPAASIAPKRPGFIGWVKRQFWVKPVMWWLRRRRPIIAAKLEAIVKKLEGSSS